MHRSAPNMISVHPSKHLAISCSAVEAVLWDTDHWERKRVLEGQDNIGVQQVFFM
jgi:hypothetical protein